MGSQHVILQMLNSQNVMFASAGEGVALITVMVMES